MLGQLDTIIIIAPERYCCASISNNLMGKHQLLQTIAPFLYTEQRWFADDDGWRRPQTRISSHNSWRKWRSTTTTLAISIGQQPDRMQFLIDHVWTRAVVQQRMSGSGISVVLSGWLAISGEYPSTYQSLNEIYESPPPPVIIVTNRFHNTSFQVTTMLGKRENYVFNPHQFTGRSLDR